MANTAYQNERSNQLNAANLAPTLANQDFANIAAMLQAGQAIDANTQANIDFERRPLQLRNDGPAELHQQLPAAPARRLSGRRKQRQQQRQQQRQLLWHVDAGDQPDGEHAGCTLWQQRNVRMSAFNFLSGPIDPNSLPALLRQKMAPGLIPGPVQPMPLASGFRAPALLPSMGFMAMPQLPPVPGFKGQDGPGIFDKLLSRFPLPGIDPNGGVIMNLDGLSGWGAPAGGGAIDPLTGLLQDLGFGGGAAGAAAVGADAAAGGAAAAGAGAAGAEAAGFSIADLLPFLLAA